MKKLISILILTLCVYSSVYAQEIKFGYEYVKIKAVFPPLSPLPTGSTFNIQLPENLTYHKGYTEVRPTWNPLGLVLDIKWDAKSPSPTYMFKFDITGIQNVVSKIVVKESTITSVTKEYVREYSYNLPAKLEIIENSSGKVVRTIIIDDGQEIHKVVFHKNFFMKDAYGSPLYNEVLGFGSLEELEKYKENDAANLKLIEHLALQPVYTKIKKHLVALYGTETVRERITFLQVKDNGTALTDIKEAVSTIMQGVETFGINPAGTTDYLPNFNQGKDMLKKKVNEQNHPDYAPLILNYHLALASLFTNDFEEANSYFQMAKNAKKPVNNFFYMAEDGFNTVKNSLELRNTLKK